VTRKVRVTQPAVWFQGARPAGAEGGAESGFPGEGPPSLSEGQADRAFKITLAWGPMAIH